MRRCVSYFDKDRVGNSASRGRGDGYGFWPYGFPGISIQRNIPASRRSCHGGHDFELFQLMIFVPVPVLWAEVFQVGRIERSEEETPVLQLVVLHPFIVSFKTPPLGFPTLVSVYSFLGPRRLAYCSGSMESVAIIALSLFHVEGGPGSGALGIG